jgi:hypothetical protein
LWNLVRYVGRPGADDEKKATVTELIPLLGDQYHIIPNEISAKLLEQPDKPMVRRLLGILAFPKP